jgi:Zn-finger nucleic acid-binding protein
MNCPSCPNELTQVTVEGVILDYCNGGCGGIWFDDKELEKFDRLNESVSFDVLKGEGGLNVVVDYSKARSCPRCQLELQRHYYDKQREILIDECASCKGVWLDPGELNHLRHLNTGEDDRRQYLDNFFAQNDAKSVPQRLRGVFQLLFK